MEKQMDYFQMVQAIREGGKARRPTWNKDEWLWSDGKILIHTTPYWTNEEKNKQIQGFPYVCEQVDVTARDWEYCAV